MDLLSFDGPLDETLAGPVIIFALDGWTDAGRAGSMAAETLQEQWLAEQIGSFDSDALYDYRDRRPILQIDRGTLGDPVWPELAVYALTPPSGGQILLVQGAEPDFGWQAVCDDVAELADLVGAERYIGLGAVPGPVPHTRVTPIITTSNDDGLLERYGRPHERVTVPASCQVVVEAAMRDEGLSTLGMWARIPHYVAGEFPAGAHALLRHLSDLLEAEIDLSDLLNEGDAHRERLDLAAQSSDEILAHIRQLEEGYDEDVAQQGGGGFGPLPSGDEIAAEFERFLRDESGG